MPASWSAPRTPTSASWGAQPSAPRARPGRLGGATVGEALQHPTWKMGKKITVDSATLVNKALEVIEAHFLFGLPYPAVQVVVHPQSVVHAFVEFVDGSGLAQVGFPTMELPILYALTHPDRVLAAPWPSSARSLEDVLSADAVARRLAREAACS